MKLYPSRSSRPTDAPGSAVVALCSLISLTILTQPQLGYDSGLTAHIQLALSSFSRGRTFSFFSTDAQLEITLLL